MSRKVVSGGEDAAICEFLLRESYDPNLKISIKHDEDAPLLRAVLQQDENSVTMLLKAGADFHRHNLLHIAAEKGSDGILGLLLGDKRCTDEVINGQDGSGRTPALVAAQHDRKVCLKMLISRGADLSLANFGGETPMAVIFENMTRPVHFLTSVLDSSVILQKNNEKNHYFVDFGVLAPRKGTRQMDVISSLLVAANDEEKTEVLQHPLIELYLNLKWSKVCYFFYLWIAAYVLFVLSLSVYVTGLARHLQEVILAIRCILIISAASLLMHGILQCFLTHGNHLRKYEMWINLACTSLSLIVGIAQDRTGIQTDFPNMPNWVLHASSIAVLLSWTELMLLIGRLPTYGYYALMFSAVLQNVIRVLLAFLCLVIGFALSFSIQFYNYGEFSDPWRALVKTTVMMMGEFEYADLFADQSHGVERTPSRVIFLMFIILTSIVLMNLMVGLAVSDIQCLQMVSHARKLEKQADFLGQLEKVLASKKFKGRYVPEIVRKLLRRNYIDTTYELETSARFRRSKQLSNKLIDSLVAIAKAHKERGECEDKA